MILPLRPTFSTFHGRFHSSRVALVLAISDVIKMKYTRRLLVLFGGRLRGWKGGVAWKDLTPFFPLLEWSNEP